VQHIVQALIAKRAEIAGIIVDLERRVAQHRADLVHIDAAIALFADTVAVAEIPPKRPVLRSKYFGTGELYPTMQGKPARRRRTYPSH
jgi:hypothetical protein